MRRLGQVEAVGPAKAADYARLAAECMDRLDELLAGERPANLINAEALGLA